MGSIVIEINIFNNNKKNIFLLFDFYFCCRRQDFYTSVSVGKCCMLMNTESSKKRKLFWKKTKVIFNEVFCDLLFKWLTTIATHHFNQYEKWWWNRNSLQISQVSNRKSNVKWRNKFEEQQKYIKVNLSQIVEYCLCAP